MPKIVDIEEQKRKIRLAAVKVFAQRGLVGTGLAHVASEAGMRRSNLYHYYADKDALIQDLADDFLAKEVEVFHVALSADGDSLVIIENLLTSILVSSMEQTSDTSRLLIQFWASAPERVRPYLRDMRETLAKCILRGQEKGEITTRLSATDAAVLLIALVDGLLAQIAMDGENMPDADDLCQSIRLTVRRLLTPV